MHRSMQERRGKQTPLDNAPQPRDGLATPTVELRYHFYQADAVTRAPVEEQREWTDAEDALLGTMTDPEVARRLGRKLRIVYDRRRQLGIPAYRGPRQATR